MLGASSVEAHLSTKIIDPGPGSAAARRFPNGSIMVARNATQNDAVAAADPTVVEVRVSAGSDDVEEAASGAVSVQLVTNI